MDSQSRILILGASGLVGSNLVSHLRQQGYNHLLAPRHLELDLLDRGKVESYFAANRPEYVFMCAGKVGGILANSLSLSSFLFENTQMGLNAIWSARNCGSLRKFLYLGSSCIYPKQAQVPIKESELLNGPLEKTNEGYGLAKIVCLKLCEFLNHQEGLPFISAMPTNLYGKYDNFHPRHSHVVPALLRRFHEAKIRKEKEVPIWGTGSPLREFLFAEDLAEALVVLMNKHSEPETVNIGGKDEVSIKNLAETIAETTNYSGLITFDKSMPDGTLRKGLDSSKIRKLGFIPKTSLTSGLKQTYSWCLAENVFSETILRGAA